MDPVTAFFRVTRWRYASWTPGAPCPPGRRLGVRGGPTSSGQGQGVVGIADGVIPSLRNVPMVVSRARRSACEAEANRMAAKGWRAARQSGAATTSDWRSSAGANSPSGGSPALSPRSRGSQPGPDKVVLQPSLPGAAVLRLYWHDPYRREGVAEVDRPHSVHVLRMTLAGSRSSSTSGWWPEAGDHRDPRRQEVFRGTLRPSLGPLLTSPATPRAFFVHRVPPRTLSAPIRRTTSAHRCP